MEIDPSIIRELCKKLNVDRSEEFGCDLILESNDKKRFLVHKNVLATYPYFRCIIVNEDLHRFSRCEKINIDFSANQLRLVINYIYTGDVNVIELSETEALYETAIAINCHFLQQFSTNTLIESISMPFALEYWRHAVKNCIDNFKSKLLELIGDNTEVFFDKFLELLTLKEFLDIIQYRKQFLIDEINFYRIIKKWIFLDYNKRKSYVESILLEKVDYSKIDPKIIYQEILNDAQHSMHPIFVIEISKILFNKTSFQENSTKSSVEHKTSSLVKIPTISSVEHNTKSGKQIKQENDHLASKQESLYLINNHCLEIHKMNIEKNQFTLMYKNEDKYYYSFATCNIKYDNHECILICGGKDIYSKTNFIWNPDNRNRLIALPDLVHGRYFHEVIFSNNLIYACGGIDESTKNVYKSTEIFNCGSEKWINGPDFVHHKIFFRLTSLDNILYAIGGTVDSQIERLDPRVSKWNKVTNCENTYDKAFPLSDYEILCMDRSLSLSSIFDIRTCKFLNHFGPPDSGIGCYDIFKLDNSIQCYGKNYDSDIGHIYEFHSNAGWIKSNIETKTNMRSFNLLKLEN